MPLIVRVPRDGGWEGGWDGGWEGGCGEGMWVGKMIEVAGRGGEG